MSLSSYPPKRLISQSSFLKSWLACSASTSSSPLIPQHWAIRLPSWPQHREQALHGQPCYIQWKLIGSPNIAWNRFYFPGIQDPDSPHFPFASLAPPPHLRVLHWPVWYGCCTRPCPSSTSPSILPLLAPRSPQMTVPAPEIAANLPECENPQIQFLAPRWPCTTDRTNQLWMSHRHLKLNIDRTEPMTFTSKTSHSFVFPSQ